MSTKTTNFNLIKPELTDAADITNFNNNWDVIDQQLKSQDSNLSTHSTNVNNPHGVTKAQVGLDQVDNTPDLGKPVSYAQNIAIEDAKKAGTDAQSNLNTHITNKSNPHNVTKVQVGLGNVPDVATNDQTPTYSAASSLTKLSSGEKLSVAFGKISKAISDLISHIGNKSNPHGVTAEQVGARSDTWTPSSSDVFGSSSNNFYNISDYKNLPYGITEGVYSGLKTNDPFVESGAKRVWVLRSHGNGASTGFILASCLSGGNDSGRTFVGNDVDEPMKWFELTTLGLNSTAKLARSLESFIANGGMSTLQSAIQVTNTTLANIEDEFAGMGKGKLFISSPNPLSAYVTVDGKSIGTGNARSTFEVEFLNSFLVKSSGTSGLHCTAVFY